jgi:hypothetical protein
MPKALVMMKENDSHPINISNFKSTCGVLFFGVPNHGLRQDFFIPMVKEQPNELLIRNLSPESDYLSQLHRNFCSTFDFPDSKIISFYETNVSPTAKKVTGIHNRTIGAIAWLN